MATPRHDSLPVCFEHSTQSDTMAKSIALVLLVSVLAATTASGHHDAQPGVQWKPRPRLEYEFELSGRSLAGLPALQGQYSGVQYGGIVRVQGLTADTAVVRLEKMSWSAMHGRLQSNWWSAQPQANETLAGHGHMGSLPMPLSGAAAVARFQDGQVHTVLVSREARDWEVNLLQGVLGHMQVQGAAHAASTANSLHGQSQQENQGAYRVMENGVSGRCLVQYEVAPANPPAEMSAAEAKMCSGKPYVQITKTKNFTDCEQYAEQSRGLPRCSPTGNACSSLWARNAVTQLIGCGSGADMQLVQAVSSSSMQAELQIREDSRASVFSSVNMTLARVQPVRQRIPTPKDGVVINGLGYRVAGKQVNGDFGLDSDYSSSEEDDNASDSVEVVRQPSRKSNQHQQDDSAEHNNDSGSDSNSSSSQSDSAQKPKKNSHKKNYKNAGSDEDSDESNAPKHKNQKHKNAGSDEDSDESNAPKPKKNSHKKNYKNSGSDDDSDESNAPKHKNQKHKNAGFGEDSDESNAPKHKNQKHKKQSNSDESDSNPRNQKNSQNDSDESDNGKHMKGKLSRKPRSAKPGRKDDADTVIVDDVFAGALSPAAVQKNATMRAALQQHLVQDLNKAASELNHQDGPSSRTMERLSMAIRLSRALSADQLSAVQNQLHDQTAKALFRDVMAMCGSEACVQQMVTMIKERKMPGITAQIALSNLASRVAVPNRKVMQYVQDLYKSSSDQEVKIAAALAIGNLAGRASRATAAASATFLAEQLTQEGKALRAPLAYALGSTAAPEATKTLIKMAKDTSVSPYQRAQAVLALRACAARSPALVRDVLLSLFHDPTESTPVRIAAVSLLVYTRPSLPLWQRLAVSTFYESNMAVTSYVWSTIQSFAKIQDPSYRQQTQFARLALPLARPVPQGAHLAFNVVAASVDAQLDRLAHQHTSFFAPADAANVYYRRVTRNAGVSSLDQEVDLWGANPDDLMQSAMEAVFGREDKASARPPTKDVPHSTRSIHDQLGIVRRRLQDPQGHLRLTLKPFISNLFLTFDKDTPNRIVKAAAQYMDKLRSETGFHAQQMGGEEVSVSTVNEMGFPVNLRIQAPWLVRAEGSAQAFRNYSAQANVSCLYTAGLSAQLSVQPSWASREYLAALNGHAMVQMPASLIHVQVNSTDGRWSVRMQPSQSTGHATLARIATQPLTSSLELSRAELASESATSHNASVGVPQGDAVTMSLWDDLAISLRAPVERSALRSWARDSRTVLGFPVLGSPLTASRLEVQASRNRAFNASFALVKAMAQDGDLQVFYPASLRQNDQAPQPEAATTTEMPSTTTSATTSTTTEASTATTAAPAVIRAPRDAASTRGPHGNGSKYVDSGDMDFTRSVFNATTLNPYNNRINGSSELYVLSQVLGGMAAGRGYVVGMNVTTEDAATGSDASHYSAFWTWGANLGGRLMRAGLFARSNADNAQMAATGAVLRDIPAMADMEAALRQSPAFMIKAEYQQIDARAVKKIVTTAVETDRSALKSRRLWQAAQENYCVQSDHAKNASVAVDHVCRSILAAANSPDQFNFTVNYNNPAEGAWGTGVRDLLQFARAYFWNQRNIAIDDLLVGHGNELGASVTLRPDGKMNAWLQTPSTFTKVIGASSPAAWIPLAAQQPGAYCGVSTSHLVTLDGVKGDIKLDGCWHLLAKDCSGKSRVAVLARADKPQSENIHVEINIDNYQIARFQPDGTATINGVLVANHTAQAGAAVQVLDAAHVKVMSIVRAEDGAMLVTLPDHGMSVVYGNSSVVIQAGASLRGRLCGVCGNYEGSSPSAMLNPKNKAEKTIQSLVDSYAIKDAQCGSSGQRRH